jgi:hypothetical protein
MKYRAICDVCGFEFAASDLKLRWDNLMVCNRDWETRHPMDFLKGRIEDQTLPWTRPELADEYVTVTYSYESPGPPSGTFNQEL